jgi:hypothetical protein
MKGADGWTRWSFTTAVMRAKGVAMLQVVAGQGDGIFVFRKTAGPSIGHFPSVHPEPLAPQGVRERRGGFRESRLPKLPRIHRRARRV